MTEIHEQNNSHLEAPCLCFYCIAFYPDRLWEFSCKGNKNALHFAQPLQDKGHVQTIWGTL